MVQTPAGPSPEELKAALKAFKKRLKLTRLDNESRLSGERLTGRRLGHRRHQPPQPVAHEVWDELARQGKLRKMGGGMYGLAEG